jgi:hypothetical protein
VLATVPSDEQVYDRLLEAGIVIGEQVSETDPPQLANLLALLHPLVCPSPFKEIT